MGELWNTKKSKMEYSASKTTISRTFGGNRKHNLCYERKYDKLNNEELLQLLREAKENEWTTLDLSDCGLESLPDELWEIQSLKLLYIDNQRRCEESYNTFNTIPPQIEQLHNLEALSISNVRNVKIPDALRKLPKLTYLDCFGCNFNTIPDNLINKNIRAIGIECDTIENLIKICKIKKIEEIFLTGSQVRQLPMEIGELKYLRTLHLVDSKVEVIPENLLNLKNLKVFNIFNTPLENKIPEEMRSQTAYELISFVCKQQMQHDTYFFNESKMIIVGQGNVGKSCLLERITNDTYEEKASTEGIDVKKWAYDKNGKHYTLNIWDFGGQEIYHSTHQFFLTKRSLYIFVWDARAEEEYGRIDYWLKTIESFAEDSPIIICINKCDISTTRVNRIDLKEYKEKYPQIYDILDISCKDNINIDRLRDLIKEQASKLQITRERWLKSWYDIRKEIEKLSESKKYITYDEYIQLCQKHHIEVNEAKSLSKYLHDLGVILHYTNDPFLKSIVILSPEWATAAVYKILDAQENVLQNKNGVLSLEMLPEIWKDAEVYPEDKYIFLLKIMEKFQLCFELNKESYLVAELLENAALDCPKGWDFSNEACIGIVYRYDFMPAGVMTRFIVRIHDYIANIDGKDMCWRKGVYLKHKTAYARVVMKDTISEKKIEVCVNKLGNSLHERELLFVIRKTLSDINKEFKKIHIEEFVPCNCSTQCKFQFPYNSLCSALDKKIDTIQCHESFQQVNILKLLEGIDIVKKEEASPYTINIQNNPIITSNVSVENSSVQTNVINFQEVKNLIWEMQGDIAEILDSLREEVPVEQQNEIQKQLEKINDEMNTVVTLQTPEDIVKSGKLNKLKRWLIDFGNKESEVRKTLDGVKSIFTVVSGLIMKFNELANKLGINSLPLP